MKIKRTGLPIPIDVRYRPALYGNLEFSAWLASGLSSFLNAIEDGHQEPLAPLPNAGILRLPIPGDIENLDLGTVAKPLDSVRRQDASVRLDDHHGLVPEFANLKRGLGARSVGGAEPNGPVRLPNVTSGSSSVTPCRHRFGAVQTPERAVWAVLCHEVKRHPFARGDAASLRGSAARLVGQSDRPR
jgi:hypothetical protein